jgi:hypothetical protein
VVLPITICVELTPGSAAGAEAPAGTAVASASAANAPSATDRVANTLLTGSPPQKWAHRTLSWFMPIDDGD